jgi:hypothetical protein
MDKTPPRVHVDRTREIERIATTYVKQGAGMQSDAVAATYERIEAESRYFQVVGELPPPRPKPKELLERLPGSKETPKRKR